MNNLLAFLLGIIQGVTEFFPVSSTGHMIFIEHLTNYTDQVLAFHTFVHLGTLIAIFGYMRKDIGRLSSESLAMAKETKTNAGIWWKSRKSGEEPKYTRIIRTNYRKMTLMILCATIPTCILGGLLEEVTFFGSYSLLYTGIGCLLTAVILFVTGMVPVKNVIPKDMPLWKACVIGVGQGFAVLPGISGPGVSMCGGILSGFSKKNAIRFAYLLSIPACVGGFVVELIMGIRLNAFHPAFFLEGILGMIAACVAGWFMIRIGLRLTRQKNFRIFAIYNIVIGIVMIAVSFI